MLHSLFYYYLLANIAIAVSYGVVKVLSKLAFFNQTVLFCQQLRFSRVILVGSLTLFLSMPFVVNLIPIQSNNNFQLAPVIRKVANNYIAQQEAPSPMSPTNINQNIFIPNQIELKCLFLIGMIIFGLKQIKNLQKLNFYKNNGYRLHKLNNLTILMSSDVDSPFCWSFLNQHYIVMPYSILHSSADFRLALRHEIQHIRQHDTYYLQLFTVLSVLFYINPFMRLWINDAKNLQEFACDETLVLNKKSSAIDYAQCLLNTAKNTWLPHAVLGIHGHTQHFLHRRITMLFQYKKRTAKKFILMLIYGLLFCSLSSVAYAVTDSTNASLSMTELGSFIQQNNANSAFKLVAQPEVLQEINAIRGSNKARDYLKAALNRMQNYQPAILQQLAVQHLPSDLLVLPLVESGYRLLQANQTPMATAGIWQFMPATAINYGLMVNNKHDDRLNTSYETTAALSYLKTLHAQFGDWRLAVMAYEIGENNLSALIKAENSRDPWRLACSPKLNIIFNNPAATSDLKNFWVQFQADLIIMHHPELI